MMRGRLLIFTMIFAFSGICLFGQERPKSAKLEAPEGLTWLNTYSQFRLSEKFFWIAQLHLRRAETAEVPFLGRQAQIYNRHAINYMVSYRFNVSLGGVLRVDYNPEQNQAGQRNTVLEPRIWHEYLFVMPFETAMVYHRFRIEHRWSRGFQNDAEYIFRNRWRYLLNVKVPLNKPKLSPGAFYASPEMELIMQSGKPIVDSPMEYLRLMGAIGYISSPRLTYAAGLMYQMGQKLSDGTEYKQNFVIRLHMYISLDFRKVGQRLPEVRIMD